MKNTAKFKSYSLLTFFLLMSIATCNAQEIFNYNNVAANSPNGLINKAKIDTVLNSDSILFTSNNSTSRTSSAIQASNGVNTLDINYSSLNQISGVQNQNIKYCIVKVTSPVSGINLNTLNQFQNLEIVHIIIETPSITGNISDLIVMNNSQVLISYQISIPQ